MSHYLDEDGDGVPDVAPADPPLQEPVPKTKPSPKVVTAAILGFLAPALLATIAYLVGPDGQSLFATMPPVLVVFLLAALTSASTYLGGYVRRDGMRELGARAMR